VPKVSLKYLPTGKRGKKKFKSLPQKNGKVLGDRNSDFKRANENKSQNRSQGRRNLLSLRTKRKKGVATQSLNVSGGID